jgi:hypothetical protein
VLRNCELFWVKNVGVDYRAIAENWGNTDLKSQIEYSSFIRLTSQLRKFILIITYNNFITEEDCLREELKFNSLQE